MATWRLTILSVWLFGCTWASTTSGAPVDASYRARSARWLDAMHDIEDATVALDLQLLREPQGDLALAARRADAAAELLAVGYRELEDATVPGFARLARDAESWLLQVALEARLGHGDIAADLYRTGRTQHCTRCHEAHERVHG